MENKFLPEGNQSPNSNIYNNESRGIVTLPPISKKSKKRVSLRPERVKTILEKSEEHDVIEKEIDDNIG